MHSKDFNTYQVRKETWLKKSPVTVGRRTIQSFFLLKKGKA